MHILKQFGRLSASVIAVAALVIATVPVPATVHAEPDPARAAWNSLGDEETQPMFTQSSIRATAEHDDFLYVGGFRYDNTGKDGAMLYRFSPETGWQDALPDDLEGENVEVRSLQVYNGDLYMSGEYRDGPADLWVYDGSSWSKDSKFALNSGGTPSIDTFYDFAVSDDNRLCATVRDYDLSFDILVICTDADGPWTALPQTGITGFDYFSTFNNDIAAVGNTLYIYSQDESDGYEFSRVWKYSLTSGNAWIQANVDGFGGNERVRAMETFDGNVYATTEDSSTWEDASVWRYNNTSTSWTKIGATNFGLTGELREPDDIIEYDGQLVIGVRNDDMLQLMTWNSSVWKAVGPYEASIGPEEDLFLSYTNALSVYRDALIIGGTNNGEGFYNSSVWASVELPSWDDEDEDDGDDPGEDVGPDADNDGVGDAREDAAPNSGDANGDGTADSEQANVSAFVSPVSNAYVALEVPDACSVTSAQMASVNAHTTKDSGFSYPLGMMNFSVSCGTPGYTATVTQYYYGTSGSYVARKYKPSTGAYLTIPDASISKVAIGGQTVTKVVYAVTDGSSLDDDGAANGVIVDPAGLGITAVQVPNTGLGGSAR